MSQKGTELSFKLAAALWLHWFWKQFPDLIYFKLNILIAKWVIWRATKKKLFYLWSRNREYHFQSYLQIDCDIMTAMILQKTISRFNLFHINVMIAEWVILESQNIKNLFDVAARNREVNFRISFWIDFDIMTTIFLKNIISRFNLY